MSERAPTGGDAGAPTSRTIPLGTGIGCHVLEWDGGSDHTLILVHGFLDVAWGWVPTVSAGLAERFHVLAPEMRGHGDSDRVGAGGYYHFFDYVADVHELVETAGRDRVSLVGHSMGGTIAGYYTGAYPEAIYRLALLEGLGPPEPTTPMPERVRGWIAGCRRARRRGPTSYPSLEDAAARLGDLDPLMGGELAAWLAARATARLDDGRYRFKHDPLHTTMGPYPFRVDVARELWRAITCPTLVVEGAESSLRLDPADRARRVASLSDAREAVLPGAGHMMQRHQPAPLAELLIDFLRDPE